MPIFSATVISTQNRLLCQFLPPAASFRYVYTENKRRIDNIIRVILAIQKYPLFLSYFIISAIYCSWDCRGILSNYLRLFLINFFILVQNS